MEKPVLETRPECSSQSAGELLDRHSKPDIGQQSATAEQWKSDPQDVDYPGTLRLAIDASDNVRGIISGRLAIPVQPGPLTLLYPKWMPGYHSPQNPIELFAGLEIRAGETILDWRRDPVEVYAFHVEVPEGSEELDVSF